MIVFALIFVVVLAVIMATIMSNAERANTQLVDTLDANAAHSLSSYESGTVKGSSVIGAINNIRTIGGQYRMEVVVYTNANTTNPTTTPAGGNRWPHGERYVDPGTGHNHQINPSGDFTTGVIYNANNVPTHLIFWQSGVTVRPIAANNGTATANAVPLRPAS
jgi:hypothetical protein